MIGKMGYIPAPSPAPPLDGSYYNMNSDRYLSYPPMDYPPMDYPTPPPLPITHMPSGSIIGNNIGGGGTLRRGARGIVPPPDVTHHTAHTTKSQHDHHSNINSSTPNGSHQMMNNSGLSSQMSGSIGGGGGGGSIGSSGNNTSTLQQKQPQSILKDPKRNINHNNLQILNVQNVSGLGNNLIVGGYDPTTTNLSSFNASLGYTDADGHLV